MAALGVFLVRHAEPFTWIQLEAVLFIVIGIGMFIHGVKKLRAEPVDDAGKKLARKAFDELQAGRLEQSRLLWEEASCRGLTALSGVNRPEAAIRKAILTKADI